MRTQGFGPLGGHCNCCRAWLALLLGPRATWYWHHVLDGGLEAAFVLGPPPFSQKKQRSRILGILVAMHKQEVLVTS